MKTKKYLERLLKDEEALNGKVRFAYRYVDFDLSEAKKFANVLPLSLLIKLNRLAKVYQDFIVEENSKPVTVLGFLWKRQRIMKCTAFWNGLDVEISKIRTRRLLDALSRDSVGHVRRNYLVFNEEAAKAFYLTLDDDRRELLLLNVGRKQENTFKLFQETRDNAALDERDIANYKSSAIFWNDVWNFLSCIKIVTAA